MDAIACAAASKEAGACPAEALDHDLVSNPNPPLGTLPSVRIRDYEREL